MGDGGKICYSKALATTGRVAYKATNGRVIYKRATDNRYATITVTLEDVEEPTIIANWDLGNFMTVGYKSTSADYVTAGSFSYWYNGTMQHIEYSGGGQSFKFKVWLDPLPSSSVVFRIKIADTKFYVATRVHHAQVTVEQDGISTLNERVGVETWGDFTRPETLIYVGFDTNIKATGINWQIV